MIRKVLRTAAISLVCGSVFLVVAVPIVLYWLGLHNIDGRPKPLVQANNGAADTTLLQQAFHSTLPFDVHALNPWTYLISLGPSLAMTSDSGSHAIWMIVRTYNSSHLKNRRMIWWHLSGGALTIWMTRNWTTDQVVAAAAAIVRTTYPSYSSSSLVEVRSVASLPDKLGSVVGYHWKCCGMVDVGEEFHPTDVVGGPDKRFIVAGVSKDSALIAYDWGNGWERGTAAAAYVFAAPDWHLVARWNLDIRPNSLSQLIEETNGLTLGIAEGHYFDKEPDLEEPPRYPAK
jgi:hypothetical protein